MEKAIEYVEKLQKFTDTLLQTYTGVSVDTGRKFDKVRTNGQVRYFVDKETWEIFGAKSVVQANLRRHFGTLHTVGEFDWKSGKPVAGTPAADVWNAKEAQITATHKPRGRPKKNTSTNTTP